MISRPHHSFFELDQWTPHDELNKCKISLNHKERDCRVLLCHDYKGGYLDDAKVQGSPVEKCYTLSKFWSLIDIFVYFSHHTITIPPVCWTQAAHTNSVSVLGTIITEGEHGQLENLVMIFGDLNNKASFSRKYADLLVDMAVYYNFDGWFINLESPLRKEYVPHLINFLKYLTARMHDAKSGSLIIWYDALTVDGTVDWQDKLTFKNKDFFDVVDGIFTNYTWKSSFPHESALLAQERNYDVFTGIDFWGRGQYGGGGFNVHKAIREIVKSKTSVALFASAWCWEYLGQESFDINETRLWNNSSLIPILPHVEKIPSTWPDPEDLGCITDFLESRPLVESFNTFFNIGYGSKYFINGDVVSDKTGWSHLGRSDIFPNCVKTSYRINYDDAFHGGSSIMIFLDQENASANNKMDGRFFFPLFKTDLDMTNGLNISLQIKNPKLKHIKTELYLILENIEGDEFRWFKEIAVGEEWTQINETVIVSNSKKVKTIGLAVSDQILEDMTNCILTIGRFRAFLSSESLIKQQENVLISVSSIKYDESAGRYTFIISWPSRNARFYELFLNDTWVGTAFTSQYYVSLAAHDMDKMHNVKISVYGNGGDGIADLRGIIRITGSYNSGVNKTLA